MKPTTATGDPAMIRRINTGIALEAVLKHAPLSRAAISEKTGLNKATVSSLVQDLLDQHLVLETGQGESSGGRKPVMLVFNKLAGHAVGVDVGANYIQGVLTDLEGGVIREIRRPHHAQSSPSIMEMLFDLIDELAASATAAGAVASPYGLVGIGIGLPGIVDETGALLFAPNMDWEPTEVARLTEKRFGVPVRVDNEANFGALGEQVFGAGSGIRHLVYVSAGIGIGTGLVLDGKLYRGSAGHSGELGHLSIDYAGPLCRCGNRGCWELYASEQALLDKARIVGCGTLDDVLERAEAGDEDVLAVLEETGSRLGVGIATIVNIFNPEAVLIGNRLSRAKRWLEEPLARELASRALPYHRSRLRLLFAELGDASAVRGAAHQAVSAFLERVKAGEGQRSLAE
jgi:predicted NBD/HSP70 family sugar kinase